MTPHESALELEWVANGYSVRCLRLMPDVTITAFGTAEAACCPGHPDVDFLNMVHLLLPADAGRVPEIARHYRDAGVQPWLELMPAPDFGRLADELSAAGGRQIGFHVTHERAVPAPAPRALPAGVAIERLGADIGDFGRVMAVGHDVPAAAIEDALTRTPLHAGVEGASLYLATVDGMPAAAAVLCVSGEIAYLANAATMPPFRRRGCQTALIERRLADAAEAGCRRACVLTTWASQSHANVARAGFRTAYTKAVWRLTPPA
jgi:GNAT superfamily N-acetyltransferase